MRHIYDMKNQFWAVGCVLGWTVKKKVWADYEQLLREVFSTFCWQKKIEDIVDYCWLYCGVLLGTFQIQH